MPQKVSPTLAGTGSIAFLEPPLTVSGAGKSLGGRHRKIEVFHDLSFEVNPSEIEVLLGSGGSGKSPLLNAVACLLPLE
jgi:ABC-type lipoprotein export system ATPase subunit